ncbi:46036_t:CDS:1, partial [Gigaspora margarita]
IEIDQNSRHRVPLTDSRRFNSGQKSNNRETKRGQNTVIGSPECEKLG